MIMTLLIAFFLGFGFGSAFYLFSVFISNSLVLLFKKELIKLQADDYLTKHSLEHTEKNDI